MVLYGIVRPELVPMNIAHFHLPSMKIHPESELGDAAGAHANGIVDLGDHDDALRTGIFRWVAQGVVVVAYLVYHVTFAEIRSRISPS